MNQQQQELYEKLLKKVNEYCLGYAAEDVIAAIDALVENYEKQFAFYEFYFRGFTYFVEDQQYTVEKIAKNRLALEIIKKKVLEPTYFETIAPKCSLTKEEYNLLKETLK